MSSTQQNIYEKRILAISGSLRLDSSNTRILESFRGKIPANVHYEIYDGLADLPHYNPVLDTQRPPESVQRFRTLLKQADAVVICSPEYAFGVPGSLKNALDWTVSSGDFVEKPVALIVAASVGENAYTSLLLTLGAINARVIDGGQLLIPFIRSKMDGAGNVTDALTAKQLDSVMKTLVAAVS